MKKNSTNRKGSFVRKLIIALAGLSAAAALLVGSVFIVVKIGYYNEAANQATLVQSRELILLAIRNLKKDAPVDPRTGDVYFPESRLYLPNPGTPLTLTYLHDTGDVTDSQGELSVSTFPVRSTERLYIAKNIGEVFGTVPRLQACARGIKVVSRTFPTGDTQNTLKQTVDLGGGRVAYVYVEKNCPELNELADQFANLRSY